MLYFRRAAASDAESLTDLYRQLVSDDRIRVLPSRLAWLALQLDNELLLAIHHDQIAATAHVHYCADAMYGEQPYAVVESIVVDQVHRRLGIGQRLIQEIEARCVARDCSKIMLMSSAARHAAHRLFQISGFNPEGKYAFVKYRRHFRLAM
ncbi:GNAT family N-acetyltransferase [Chitinivorax sp. B]|uniref:GNAT family N-acetyltransferase n=1 Tax=Chitinivorax sp. B TaxID=2502235 RepID=UPI0010F8824A|nr:GNAT family N-acetyltransferase [Chitinivorax sp. B]